MQHDKAPIGAPTDARWALIFAISRYSMGWISWNSPLIGSPKCATTPNSAVRSRLLSKEDVEQTLAIMKRCRLEACKSLSEVDKAVPRGEIEHT